MRQGFRQSMAWLHSWSGLLLGWLLFAIAATGTATVFKSEIGDWMRPELSPAPSPERALTAAIRHLGAAAGDSPAWYITAPDERSVATIVSYEAKNAAGEPEYRLDALDPVTGSAEGIRETLGGEFFYRFHFELQLPYPWGRMLASAAAMLMLIALISGIITHRRIFADFFTMRPGKGKRSWLDAHNVLGVLALPFHLMITFTGILTLITLTFPWAGTANYGDDLGSFFAESAPGFYSRPAADRPAPMGDVAVMLADARRQFDGGRIGRLSVDNPGDAAAVMLVSRHDGDQLAFAPSILAYDMGTGKLLSRYVETRPVKRTYDVLYGLHIGRFAPEFSRWLYFLCGLALSAAIATGMVLWTASRSATSVAHRAVKRLTAGAIGGLPLAMALFFWSNRLLPAGMPARADAEVRWFFTAWGTAILFGLIRPARRAWIEIMALTAVAWLLLPIISALATGRGLPASLWHGDWVFAGFDLVAIALGALAAAIAVKAVRYRPPPARTRTRTA